MKKALLFFAAALMSVAVSAQTIVSTDVQKRNVLLEEFTGVGCGYCPDGHARANAICEEYEGHAWAINIHAGYYANGSAYTTPAGDAVHNDWGNSITGYPCGTVNRSTIQDRGQWAAKAASIRNQDAIVNIAAQGTMDPATRTVTMHIEAYYTGNSTAAENYFNIAITQDNILGQQSNYGNYNPDYIEGSQYRHMHMLRDLMCGNWGVAISATQGSFLDTTITYVVPAEINGLAVADINDLNFIAFITESHRNVLNAQKVIIPETAPRLTKVLASQAGDCSLQYNFTATVVNNTTEAVNGVVLTVDGTDIPYTVSIPSMSEAVIDLDPYTFTVSGEAVQTCNGTKSVSLKSYTDANGQGVTVNGAAKTVEYGNFNIYTVEGPIHAKVGYDGYGEECSVSFLKQNDCSTLLTAGPWTRASWPSNPQYISQLPNTRYEWLTFSPSEAGLYIFRLKDGYGDGWSWTNDDNPSGVWMEDANGQFINEVWGYSNGPSFERYDIYLNITNAGDGTYKAGIDDVAEAVSVNAYPNPASMMATITAGGIICNIDVVNALGQKVSTIQNVNADRYEMNLDGMESGIYFLNVTTDKGVGTQRLTVVK